MRVDKPAKPYADFPLFAHDSGQWAKRIRDKTYYFGVWADPIAALDRYLAVRDYLYTGREPPAETNGVTLDYLIQRFLHTKKDAADTGEIEQRTFLDYKDVCARLLKILDSNLVAEHLAPSDFERVRRELAKYRGPTSLANDITRIRVLFKYGVDQELLTRPPRYGNFKKPNRRVLRRARRERGKVMFEPFEINLMLLTANPWLRAMIFLGINCGFGNHDCACLPNTSLDFDAAWLDFPRPKTEVERRCPLWPETIQALQAAAEVRPANEHPTVNGLDLVFLTHTGRQFDHHTIGKEFRILLRAHDIYRPGIGFYALRHTFQTIGEVRGEIPTKFIMGHAPPAEDMSATYREQITEDRLKAVTDYVRRWLFNDFALRVVG